MAHYIANRYLRFYRCHMPYMLDKTGKVFICNICCFYTTSVIVLMLVSISQFTVFIFDFQNDDRQLSWILVFSQCLSKIQISAYFYVDMQYLMKIGRSAAELLRVFNFRNTRILMLPFRHLGIGMTSQRTTHCL